MADSLRETITEFLDLVERPPQTQENNEQLLIVLLDRLALASHGSAAGAPSELEVPDRDYQDVRARVEQRFPSYGLYTAPSVEPGAEPLTGDAIDDITDIAIDLSEVAWLWENAGEEAARWQFLFGFKTHWGEHLRELQWYCHAAQRTG